MADYPEHDRPPRGRNRTRSWASVSVASWSFDFITGNRPESVQDEESVQLEPITILASSQKGLVEELKNTQEETSSLKAAREWYIRYIANRFEVFWELILPIVRAFDDEILGDHSSDCPRAYDLLKRVALQASQSEISLSSIVDDLAFVFKNAECRDSLYQAVFIFLGWLSMMYDPLQDPDKLRLRLAKEAYESKGTKSKAETTVVRKHSQRTSHTDLKQPMYNTLEGFGDLVPDISLQGQHLVESEPIQPSWITYQALRKVLYIRIQWVDTINQHLEFNESHKTLKVFRCPSMAFLHFKRKKKQHTFVSRMFEDNARYLHCNNPSRSVPENGTSSFFRELLETYRIIFSQDKKSTELFRREMRSLRHSVMDLPDSDPMLELLCGTYYARLGENNIFDEIKAGPVTDLYRASEFPHFGDRLLALQRFSRANKARSFTAVWFDSRDQGNWWQVWALMVGAGTALFAFVALGLQLWQVVLAQLQWSNSPAALPQPSKVSLE